MKKVIVIMPMLLNITPLAISQEPWKICKEAFKEAERIDDWPNGVLDFVLNYMHPSWHDIEYDYNYIIRGTLGENEFAIDAEFVDFKCHDYLLYKFSPEGEKIDSLTIGEIVYELVLTDFEIKENNVTLYKVPKYKRDISSVIKLSDGVTPTDCIAITYELSPKIKEVSRKKVKRVVPILSDFEEIKLTKEERELEWKLSTKYYEDKKANEDSISNTDR